MGSSDGHYFLDNGNICPSQLTIAVHQFPARPIAGILHLWECRLKVLPKRLMEWVVKVVEQAAPSLVFR